MWELFVCTKELLEMGFQIDRELIRRSFINYTDSYDLGNEKIKLKVEHTFRVADLAEKIAKSLNVSDFDVDLAWTIGILHDIGRFEQIRQYGTFEDAKSISHARLGVQILYDEGLISEFVGLNISEVDLVVIREAILYHSDFRIPKNIDQRSEMFCNIIRDADKIDILKVVYETNTSIIYGVTEDELRKEVITVDVMRCFDEKHAVQRSLRKQPIDNIVGYASFVYELVFLESRNLCNEQGYIWKILEFKSNIAEVNKQIGYMREKLKLFLKR